MEINTITEKEYLTDKIQNKVNDIFGQKNYTQKPNVSVFSDIKLKLENIIENLVSKSDYSIEDEINSKFLDLDFGSVFEINADKIGVNDAIFFINLLNQENLINYSVEDGKISINAQDGKKIEASNPLLKMLSTSIDTKKPIRLDFDNDITVILKMDKNGKINAHFIPGTSEVENYLKNNISCLKQRFDEEDINYNELSYSKYKNNEENQKQKKKRGK
jgi:hypothetical protein